MSEDFEGEFPSASWQFYSDPTWGADDYKPRSGSKSAWCARSGDEGLDPAIYDYANDMNAWMVYGPFDLSDASTAELIFYLWLDTEKEYDYFKWVASKDGSKFSGYRTDESTNGWIEKKFDLKTVPTLGNLCGTSDVWIGFIFESDSLETQKGAFIDDLVLRKAK
jgi:hypothetical protein